MALFCKENHCGSCEKAFCCFSCRCKHENHFHKKPTPIAGREVLAPVRNITVRRKKSLPQIPESENMENIRSDDLNNEEKKISIGICNETSNLSQFENQLKYDDKGGTKNGNTGTEEENSVEILTNEKKTQQEVDLPRKPLSEKKLNTTTTTVADMEISEAFQHINTFEFSEAKENISIDQMYVPESQSFYSTAGNTPPRTQTFDKTEPTDSISREQSTTNENSSVYCACSDNMTKSKDSKLKNPQSGMYESSSAIEISDCTEKSSVYFACSEYLVGRSSAEKSVGSNDEGFDEFENDPKLASTKLELTISFAPETYYEVRSEMRTETIDSTDAEYVTPSLKGDTDESNGDSNIHSISDDNGSDSTISARNDHFSIFLDDCNSINEEKLPKAPEQLRDIKEILCKTGTTQTSMKARANNIGRTFEIHEESKENYKPVYAANEQNNSISLVEPSISSMASSAGPPGDNSFWFSFSNSIHRVYNSTKEMCSNLGRKNHSKRLLEDIEEILPEPKRPKVSIKCRPPIRENPKIVFRQDGDIRRPVIAFDKSTQTDF